MESVIVRMIIQVVIISGSVGLGARRLGYSGVLWFVAQFMGGWFTLGMVSALPDRKVDIKRSQELAELRQELQNRKRLADPATPVPQNTIGDQATIRG